ncbi:hypothetical protein [Larkinella soli]|uniref:hypothetical protein n=1 Tax=Larkinella soli TaxID=1770527 RepID=UPI000FFB499F|nr:hypothetical protein [Larkinella soli]
MLNPQETLKQDAQEVIDKRLPISHKERLSISVDSNAQELTINGLNYEEQEIVKEILRKEYGYHGLR